MNAARLAATHLAAFGDAAWPETDFARYLNDPTVFIAGDTTTFAVFRVLGPEAEILTLATDPAHQSKGRASAMLDDAIQTLRGKGVEDVFLDVAADNAPALALYARAGFETYAERRNYYHGTTTALCMKIQL